MKQILIILCLSLSSSLFGQKNQQLSVGVGLNNVLKRVQNINYRIESTNCILDLDYNYTFKNKAGLRATLAFASFGEKNISFTGEERSVVINALSFNIGPMYHFLRNKKLDLSSGFSLGRKFRWGISGDPYSSLPTSFYVYSINLLNVKYFPFNDEIGFFGEVIIDEAYFSNYFVGLVYQF
mgnify:CR=1 FL=1